MARQKATPFDLPTGEGAPSKSEGVGGAFWRGSRETFPSWVWAKPMVFLLDLGNEFATVAEKRKGENLIYVTRKKKRQQRLFFCF